MQHIQDKEFDQLFRDKFDGAEVQPSAGLWEDIEAQLPKKRERILPVFWLAAALACISLSIGLWFNQMPKKVQLQLVNYRPAHPITKSSTLQHHPVQQSVVSTVKPAISHTRVVVSSPGKVVRGATETAGVKKDLVAMQPLELNSHPDYKALDVKQQKLYLPVTTSSPPKDEVLLNAGIAAADNKPEVINENNTQDTHKGIRNIGDLVNYVVDKVDKREEKFLQFKTEDDNSSLIAINIGIIRFNAKKTHLDK